MCQACANQSPQSPSWHTFEVTHAGSLLNGSMAWNQRGQGNGLKATSAKFSARWTQESRHDVYAKIAPGVPIHVGNRTRWKQMHAVSLLFRPQPNIGTQNFGMWGMHNLAKAYRSIKSPLPIAESMTGRGASNGHTKDTARLFHGPWHDPVANIFVRSHLGCGTDSVSIRFFAGFTNISKTQKRCK